MLHRIGAAAAGVLLGGCLYVEAGGGVYGGNKGAAAGWQVAGGLYFELDQAKFSTGGGGSVISKDGTHYAGGGIHTKLDVNVSGEDNDPRMRGTLAVSFAGGEPDDDIEDGYAVMLGGTFGLILGETDMPIISHAMELWGTAGLDLLHAGDATFVGPAVRFGIGGNAWMLFPGRN